MDIQTAVLKILKMLQNETQSFMTGWSQKFIHTYTNLV